MELVLLVDDKLVVESDDGVDADDEGVAAGGGLPAVVFLVIAS